MRWIAIDKLVELDPGKSASGTRKFFREEIFFRDHFPGFPVVPGAVQLEMISLVGGICVRAANKEIMTVLSAVKKATFRKNIEPGDLAVIRTEVVAIHGDYSIAKGVVEVNGEKTAEAEVMYSHVPWNDKLVRHEDAVVADFERRNKGSA